MYDDDKVQLKVWISKRTDKRIRAHIAQKYNVHIKGLLSFETEELLIDGLDSRDKGKKVTFYEKDAHTPIGTNLCSMKGQKAEQLIDAISTWVMKEYNLSKPPTVLPYEMLKKAIIAVAEVQDSRSIKSRIELIKAHSLLRGVGKGLYEIPYNRTEIPPSAPPVERGTFREV